MPDFMLVTTKSPKKEVMEVYPKFIIKKTKDLMIRGGDFYAVWDEEQNRWSTDEDDALAIIDKHLDIYKEEHAEALESFKVRVCHMWDAESGMIDKWHKYCQQQMRDTYHMLDEKLVFANTKTKKSDYSSKSLPYPLEAGECPAYDKIIGTLYSPEERHKIEWAIGSIVAGDSAKIQKFLVLYGSAGTGKSTILNIIQQLFDGYYSVFDAKALGSSNNSFALEAFKSNPLVAIQHDGDLSRIEDNTRLNSLVSHEIMTVNEKFKSTYSNRFNCFLFMGTNKPVKITDAKSGLLRRLIDVRPSGNKLDISEYRKLNDQIKFELGAIAEKCRQVYMQNPHCYDSYVPVGMLDATNDFYNFIGEVALEYLNEDAVSLTSAWARYKQFCEDARVPYPYSRRIFGEELKNYFREFYPIALVDGKKIRNYYKGFRKDRVDIDVRAEPVLEREFPRKDDFKVPSWLDLKKQSSIFDSECADYPAQYASESGTPNYKWENVKTTLKDLDTSKLHYIRVPENHIVIDFDIQDSDGNKLLEENLKEAAKWPKTYAEVSKSGAGIHLHYIYSGDVSKLSRIYDDHIEVKIYSGKSSLRRMLTLCNAEPINTISSGLPLRGDKKMLTDNVITSERGLRTIIKKSLAKEYQPGTKPSVEFIKYILDKAYNSPELHYDVSDMQPAIFAFARHSTHHSQECCNMVAQMKFKSREISVNTDISEAEEPLCFYDIEVFPNLFIVNYKFAGKDKPVIRLINPKADDIEALIRKKLVGFNCRRYDNHILYARLMGYNIEQLYEISQRIISGDRNAFFGEAYNISYTDVYDFSAKKQSLKKWEIELGIHHLELGLPWDQPVPKEQWEKVAEYCDNDVVSTEAVFDHLQGDFTAREILADIAGMTVNDTTNSLTTRIIFGMDRHPQLEYTDLSVDFPGYEYVQFGEDGKRHNMYRGVDLGFGGYVYAEPGMYSNVALLDVASLHPHSAVALNAFGKYTKNFKDLMDARIFIKHGDYDSAKKLFDGKLAPYLNDPSKAKQLAQALKIAINSVYGLTSASFDNPFKDPRNVNNIVALRGALFMKTLQDEVAAKGFTVAHIKTDTIKIPNATPEIIDFCMKFAEKYGYTFEHEATYDRMCLVNDAVYIAHSCYGDHAGEWTATGKQFQIPYVFKKLFSKEKITFEDMCETKSVQTAIYLDMNEGMPKGEHNYRFIGKVGQFCPVVDGAGGGYLMRQQDVDKYTSVTGTKKPDGTRYRWMESQMVLDLNKQDQIDKSYYNRMCDEAIDTISQYGDFERFVSGE